MIYSSQVYHPYECISYSHPNSAEKKLSRERIEKATALKASYEYAWSDYGLVEEIRRTLLDHLYAGDTVTHKTLGQSVATAVDGEYISVQFPSQSEPKKFLFLPSLGGGFISLDTEDDAMIKENAKLLQRESSLARALKSAEDALAPYQQYLE